MYIQLLLANDTNAEAESASKRGGRWGRWAKVGTAGIVGAGLLVITGGLAAPAIGVGISALGIGSVGAFIGTATGGALLTALFGAGGAGLASYKMHRRVGALSNFGFTPISNDGSIHVTIYVSGLLLPDQKDNVAVWEPLTELIRPTCADTFTLEWETQAQVDAGRAVSEFISSQATGLVVKTALQQTVLNTVMAAVAAPVVIMSGGGYLIDNPWGVLISKADQAGVELGHVLLDRMQGSRPVSLIGFSAGARVILRALEFLYEHGAFGIVEDVYLLGCPASSSNWCHLRAIVAGRFVNAYSPGDWVLSYVYRAATASTSACGLTPVGLAGIEDIDVSAIATSHSQYVKRLPELIAFIRVQC